MPVLSPEIELQRFADRNAATVVDRIQQLVLAEKQGPQAQRKAMSDFTDMIRFTQQHADLLGRRRMFLELDAVPRESAEAARVIRRLPVHRRIIYADPVERPSPPPPGDNTPLLPNVSFRQAVDDLVAREPRLAPSADEVAAVYSREHGFALARAAQVQVTEAVQRIIRAAFGAGVSRTEGIARIAETALLQGTEAFSRGYAETVYRTNLATAFTAGRFQQAADPDISQVLPAFTYRAIKDSAVRRGRPEDNGENHLALDGLTAATASAIWQTYAPPNGYNCRCQLRMKSIFELRREGVIQNFQDPIPEPTPPGVDNIHPRFAQGRPDHAIYFGVSG